MLYPFLFMVYDHESEDPVGVNSNLKPKRWIVLISVADGVYYNTDWMDDPSLPNNFTLIPDVDIVREEHYFYSEIEALIFIKKWWASQEI